MRTLKPAIWRGLYIGLLLILVSLPGLFLAHGAFGLGTPPMMGLILLGGTVVLSLVLANMAGFYLGQSRQSPWLAALLGLVLGGAACAVVAPFYGGLVVDRLTRDATSMAWHEREKILGGAKSDALDSVPGAFSAWREGRLTKELANLQEQARNATTPQARQNAAVQAKIIGVQLLKSGAASASAFGLLLWAIIAPPIGAAFECRRAKR